MNQLLAVVPSGNFGGFASAALVIPIMIVGVLIFAFNVWRKRRR